MKTFGWSYQHVRFGLSGAQAWAWYAWAMENEQMGFGSAYKRGGDAYIKQEVKKRLAKK